MKKYFFFVFLALVFFASGENLWAMGKRPAKQESAPGQKTAAVSLSLEEAYDLAVKRSETLAISKEEIGRTMGSFLTAAGEAIGDFDYQATELRQDPQKGSSESNVGSTFSASERRERKFIYTQPLFQGFRALGALSGAGSLKKQRVSEWERAKQLLFVDIVNAYYDYVRLQKEIEIIEGIITLSEDRIKDLKQWQDIGRSRPSESTTARVTLETFKAERAKAKSDLANARNLFTFLVGMAFDAQDLDDETLPTPDKEPFDLFELVRQRPDVEAGLQAVKTARGGLIVAQSDLWPKITLDADLYQHREGFQSGTSWDTLVTLKVPLGKGGTTVGSVRDALSVWREAKLNYSLARRKAQREIMDAYDNWKNDSERYKALEKSMEAAQENFTLQNEDYRRRMVSNLDVLQALQSLFETKRDANSAFYDMKKSYWELETAKGHCCGGD